MELRRLSLWLALFVIAAISQCSESHTLQKRESNDVDDDFALADEASDDEAQNDENGDGEEEEPSVNVSIVTKPKTYRVHAGDAARLECQLDPADALDAVVQWSGDKDKYSIASVITINDHRFKLDNNDLIINNVNTSDSGSFECAVLQKNGATIRHNLIVSEAPKIEFSATNNGHVEEGSRLVITCDVNGTPPPQITWSKATNDTNGHEENEKLTESAGIFTHNSLIKDPVKKEDAGRYYCYAFNAQGNSQKAIDIVVDSKPHIHVPRTVVNSDFNIAAELQCSSHETPVPRFHWFKDNVRIENIEEYYSITTDGPTSNLTIKPRNLSDFGIYTCEARNRFGSHARSVQLVQRPVLSSLQAAGAALALTVHSHAPLTHLHVDVRPLDGDVWRKIEVPLPNTTGHEHVIKYVINEQDLQPGKYEARAKAQNTHQLWSDEDLATIVEIDEKALPIQQSAVLGAGSNSNQLYASIMPTLLIYLLVRMF